MLTERRSQLLSLIIGEYVDTAVPVGSETILRRYELPFSSATIRNEMARLEEDGYVSHPHTSAGGSGCGWWRRVGRWRRTG